MRIAQASKDVVVVVGDHTAEQGWECVAVYAHHHIFHCTQDRAAPHTGILTVYTSPSGVVLVSVECRVSNASHSKPEVASPVRLGED